MRAKQVLTLFLAAFVIVAVAFVVIGDFRQDSPEMAPVMAAAVAPANLDPTETPEPMPATPEPEVMSEAPEPINPPAPPKAVASVPEPVKAPPVAAKAQPAASIAVVAPHAKSHKVVATYFHGNVRCTTCRKVETYAREAVEEGFRSEIDAGVVEFRTINVEEPANRHYIQDYQLMTRSVVVTDEVEGAVAQWTRLDQVWAFVGNRPAYLNYVQDAVRGYLELH